MKWPTLDSGEMRHQITILQQTKSSDASGNTVVMAPLYTGVWAKIEPVRGTDVIRSGQVTTQLFLTVSIWWQAGIMADMQVQTLNGLYVIQSVENLLEMDAVLKLNCVALGRNDD
jgi:SPP1 family predicted phage head-tail adaptor